MRLPAWLSELLPPSASPEDEAALDRHLAEMIVFYSWRCAVVLNLLHLLFWPTDRWLLPDDPTVQGAMRWFRMTTFTNHTLFLLALSVPVLRRHGAALFCLCMLISSALLGSAMARLGGLSQPYFYLTCLAPMGVSALPARLSRRLWISPACGAALVLAFLLTRPAELHSPRLGSAIGAMVFAVAISLTIGHGIFLLTRRALLSERALARSQAALRDHNERLEDRVAESARELRRLAAHLLRVAEDERGRLARELHDELGQQVTALRYSLAAARRSDPSGLWLRLDDLEEGLAQLNEGLRHLVTDLRPRILDERGLVPALQWLIERTAARTGLPCALTLSGATEQVVPAEPAVAVFRIVQESLTNALRHAEAGRLDVALAIDADGIEARVRDDGCGVGTAAPGQGGMGLLGMSERARALGGTLTLTSHPGAGTEVRVRLPLQG